MKGEAIENVRKRMFCTVRFEFENLRIAHVLIYSSFQFFSYETPLLPVFIFDDIHLPERTRL